MLKSQEEKIKAINPKIMIVGIGIAKKTHWVRVIHSRSGTDQTILLS